MARNRDEHPEFFDYLDSDPEKAKKLFTAWVFDQIKQKPPRMLRWVPEEERTDAVHDVILKCLQKDFKKLRSYEPQGKPFGGWFTIVLSNHVLDKYRRAHIAPETELAESEGEQIGSNNPGSATRPERARMLGVVRDYIAKLERRCRMLLKLAACEFKPQEIARLLRLDKSEAKKLSNSLGYCRRKLMQMLRDDGYSEIDLFGTQ